MVGTRNSKILSQNEKWWQVFLLKSEVSFDSWRVWMHPFHGALPPPPPLLPFFLSFFHLFLKELYNAFCGFF